MQTIVSKCDLHVVNFLYAFSSANPSSLVVHVRCLKTNIISWSKKWGRSTLSCIYCLLKTILSREQTTLRGEATAGLEFSLFVFLDDRSLFIKKVFCSMMTVLSTASDITSLVFLFLQYKGKMAINLWQVVGERVKCWTLKKKRAVVSRHDVWCQTLSSAWWCLSYS